MVTIPTLTTLSKAQIADRQDSAKAIQADLETLMDTLDKDTLPATDDKNLGIKNKAALKGQLKAAHEHLGQFIKMVGK